MTLRAARIRAAVVGFAVVMGATLSLKAQETPKPSKEPNQETPKVADTPKKEETAPAIISVEVSRQGVTRPPVDDGAGHPLPAIRLGDTLVMHVDGLDRLTRSASDARPLSLFVDGILIPGVAVLRDPGSRDVVRAIFDRVDGSDATDNRRALIKLLGNAHGFSWPAKLTIGSRDRNEGATAKDIVLELANSWKAIVILVFSLVLLGLFWFAATQTAALRDSGVKPTGDLGTYSLARTQMAVWFVAVAIAFLAIWGITGVTGSITTSVLALMGIGSGTALGAALVDSSKRAARAQTYAQLQQEKERLERSSNEKQATIASLEQSVASRADPAIVTALATTQKDAADIQTRLVTVGADMRDAAPEAQTRRSEGFINDILSDDDGYSLHRVQMAGWTLVLLIVFVADIYHDLSMPDFDGTLLALMGISAGTYLGFKLPEKQSGEPGAGAPGAK